MNIQAYCCMSNHLHLIISAEVGKLSEIIRDFKKFTAKEIIKAIQEGLEELKTAILKYHPLQ